MIKTTKINKETSKLSYSTAQMNLTDFYRIFHPTIKGYTLFSAAHGTFFKIYHILSNKVSLNKYNDKNLT